MHRGGGRQGKGMRRVVDGGKELEHVMMGRKNRYETRTTNNKKYGILTK